MFITCRGRTILRMVREFFVGAITAYLIGRDYIISLLADPVKGVSLAPVHQYGAGRPELIGKTCVVLGRERAGVYTGLFNFFGGKLEVADWTGMTLEARAEAVAMTLFDEVAEELGIFLNPEFLLRSLVAVTKKGPSIIFWNHITGISRGAWSAIMADPFRRSAWKFQEMDVIEHVPVDTIATRADLSVYVKETVEHAKLVIARLDVSHPIPFNGFEATTGKLGP